MICSGLVCLRPRTVPTAEERFGTKLQCRRNVHERAVDIPVSVSLRIRVSGKTDKGVTALLQKRVPDDEYNYATMYFYRKNTRITLLDTY